MTPRENWLSMLRRQGYEYAPVHFSLCPSLETQYAAAHGDTPYGEYFDFPMRSVYGPFLPAREPVDWTTFYPDGLKDGTTFWQEWGIAYEPSSDGTHFTHMRHPMVHFDSLEQLQAYPFPDYANAQTAGMAQQVADIQAQGYATIGDMAVTIWETSWYLRSMEALMMDMAMEDEKAIFLLDKVTELACIRAAAFAAAGTDMIFLGDDIGMQSRLMMAPEFYQEWLKPRLTKVIQAAKDIKPDVLIGYHSCGFVTPAIQDLIDAGVDVLNPVQPECMDFADIHAEFGDRLSFWGTVGTQTTMPFGTTDEVREVVHRNLQIAGDKGGLFCTPTHVLEPEVPWANVEAYVEACRAFTVRV